MKKYIDQLGRVVLAPRQPQRIISLVPSQTEFLLELGLGSRVVGRTKFCVHPHDAVAEVQVVGGTKNFRFATIDGLQPDLIIGNKEENYEEGISTLAGKYPVWMSDIATPAQAVEMMQMLGEIVGLPQKAVEISGLLMQNLSQMAGVLPPQKTIYLIWQKPYMAAGKATFIDAMMALAGLKNCVNDLRYPVLTEDQIQALAPEVVLLSSEPFPFGEKHIHQISQLVPKAKCFLVDGEMFSWYGSRLCRAANYFRHLAGKFSS